MGLMKLWDRKFHPYVEREEWEAEENLTHKKWYLMEMPITYVRFLYEDLFTKHNTIEHIRVMREEQRYNMEIEKYGDIKFNFMINREGVIYEGSGWYDNPVLPEKYVDLKHKCLDVLYIGDFSKEDPSYTMLKAGMYLIMVGLKELYIDANFKIIPIRDETTVI